ncbi:TPA: helix-turn-helix domain-containing protein [Clostridioides difficile]|nr:helix-turn-helix domain-containing protein [Clostridioides difficile]
MNFIQNDTKNKKNILEYRIKEARIARGLTQQELADKLNVTKQLLSKYEKGVTKPSIENLIMISKELDFPIEFFMKEKKISLDDSRPIFFRSLGSASKKMKSSLGQNTEFVEEIYDYLSDFIEFPKFNIDKNITKDYKIGVSEEYIENVANKLREYWNLGDGPIDNLTKVLEKNGVIITRLELNTHKVDAFSCMTISGVPIIVLGSDKGSAVRSRMDISHELWHILFHSNLSKEDVVNNHKILEEEAKKFAGIFTLPSKEFSEDIYSINIDNFIYLKKKWKISIAAMVVRAHDLKIITDEQYTYLNKRISFKKWRAKEPLDDLIPLEKPQILKQAIKLLLENSVVSIEELTYNIALSKREIEKFCSLDENYLGGEIKTTKPYLKIIK